MPGAGHQHAARAQAEHELPDTCQWLADAYAGGDPEQISAALCALYQLMASRGWIPPERATTLLRVRNAAVEAALSRLVEQHMPPLPAALETNSSQG
jgi:hypothetical protein